MVAARRQEADIDDGCGPNRRLEQTLREHPVAEALPGMDAEAAGTLRACK